MGKTPFLAVKEICHVLRSGLLTATPDRKASITLLVLRTSHIEGRLRLFCWADRLRQSVKLRSVVYKPQSPFRASKKIVGSVGGQAYFVRQSVKLRSMSQEPQIPFCTKRKVVVLGLFTALRALCLFRLERVCATHFLRLKAVGRVGFKSDLPIDGYHRQMVNRILSPTLPEYRPARAGCGVGRGGRFGGVGKPERVARWVWVGRFCLGGYREIGGYMETRKAVFSRL